nr:ABC transporter permease [Clostridiales bacterium]
MQTVHTHITAGHRLFDLKLGELRRYRGLIWLFTKRSFVVTYKQTVLGPLWVLLTPLLTSFIHMVVFGGIAKLSTDGVPQLLFYLTGNALWGFFAACVASGCATFTTNASLFSKVYFPRLVMPLSDILGNALRFAIQLIPVVILLGFYAVKGAVTPHFSCVIVVPFVLLQLAALGMGFGLIISSLTTKYRDLRVLVS